MWLRHKTYFRREPKEVEASQIYEFIETKLPEYQTMEKCKILGVTKQGYYQWKKTRSKPYKYAALLAMIKKVFITSKARGEHPENAGNYGANRVFLRLKHPEYGFVGSYSTVYRVMKAHSLLQKRKRNPNSLTTADREAQKSENIIQQDFTAEKPNAKWLTDVSEILTADGKLYIAPVLDCFDGAIVGLSMAGHMRAELCISAFEQACKHQNARGMILHSDRGSAELCSACTQAALSGKNLPNLAQSRVCPVRAGVTTTPEWRVFSPHSKKKSYINSKLSYCQ